MVIYNEVKKNIFTISFFVMIFFSVIYVFFSIKADDKYHYAQPLSKKEYIYFSLKDDLRNGDMKVYYDDNLYEGIRILSETDKENIRHILKIMNPEYDVNEKISDVKIVLPFKKVKKLMHQFEYDIGEKTGYFSMLDYYSYPTYKYRRFTGNHSNKDGFNTYKEEKADYRFSLDLGISKAYARYVADILGLLMGLLPGIISVAAFSADRKNHVNEMLFSTPVKSCEFVLSRFFSITIPFVVASYLGTGFCSVYFYHLNKEYYGYDFKIADFFSYTTVWVVPTIIVTVSLAILSGLLIHNTVILFAVQFIIWFLSIYSPVKNKVWHTVIRFNSLGNAAYYLEDRLIIHVNRLLVFLLAIVFLFISCKIYENVRTGNTDNNKFVHCYKLIKRKINAACNHNENTKSRMYYQLKSFAFSNIIMGVLYIMIVFMAIYAMYAGSINADDIKTIGEVEISLVSLFIYGSISILEKRHDMQEFVYVSNSSYIFLFFQRIFMAALLVACFVLVPVMMMSCLWGIHLGIWIIGVYLSSLFIGILALCAIEILENRNAGLLFALLYYLLCMFLKNKMKYFSILGYTYHIEYSKYQLCLGVVILLILLYIINLCNVSGVRNNS